MGSFGKKTSNPGYDAGNHWLTCDVCGFIIRSEDARERWDGLVVCPEDWEIRHPQDFLRGREDDMVAKGLRRPDVDQVPSDITILTEDRRYLEDLDRTYADEITLSDYENGTRQFWIDENVPSGASISGSRIYLPTGGIREDSLLRITRTVANGEPIWFYQKETQNLITNSEFFQLSGQPKTWQDVTGPSEAPAVWPDGAYQTYQHAFWLHPDSYGSRGGFPKGALLQGGNPVRSFLQEVHNQTQNLPSDPWDEPVVIKDNTTYTAGMRLKKDSSTVGYFLFELRFQSVGVTEQWYSCVVDLTKGTMEPIRNVGNYAEPIYYSITEDRDRDYWLLTMSVKSLPATTNQHKCTFVMTPNFVPSLYGAEGQFPDKYPSLTDTPDDQYVISGCQMNEGSFLEPYPWTNNELFYNLLLDEHYIFGVWQIFDSDETGTVTFKRIRNLPKNINPPFPNQWKVLSKEPL